MKRTLSILLALITLLSALTITTLPATAFAVGGNVGDCTWGFNGDTGRLTISGSGSTGDFKESPPAWYDDYASEVTEVVIGDDVTEIGEGVFYGHSGVRSVTIGSGVRIIGRGHYSRERRGHRQIRIRLLFRGYVQFRRRRYR